MAIKLENKTNAVAPTVDFPYGDLKDNTGSNDGVPVNRGTQSDLHQFFAKLLADSGVVANGLLDNATNGFQYFESLVAVIKSKASEISSIYIKSGNAKSVTVGANDRVAALSEDKILVVTSSGVGQAYEFIGSDWVELGNASAVFSSDHTYSAVSSMSETRVCNVSGIGSVAAFDFDGTNWVQVGNSLNLATECSDYLHAYMGSNRVVMIGINSSLDGNTNVRTLEFDGVNWTQIGNDLDVSTDMDETTNAAALSENSVCLLGTVSAQTNKISKMTFDGTDWTFTGIQGDNTGDAIGTLSEDTIVFHDNSSGSSIISTSTFNGTNWVSSPFESVFEDFGEGDITALSPTKIVLLSSTANSIQSFTT
jgi:hypothetical protein